MKNANVAGAGIFQLRKLATLRKVNKELNEVKERLDRGEETLTENRKQELKIMQEVYQYRIEDLEILLDSGEVKFEKKRKAAAKRIALSLIERCRLKKRNAGAGAKVKMGEEEEQFLAECLEERASIHDRRSEGILFYGKQIKQKDLLSIVNYKRLKMGRSVLKSAITVVNRARPRNKRSIQAQHHIGKSLFCSRTPPPRPKK